MSEQQAGSTKRISLVKEANAYHKNWFMETKRRVAEGEPFVFLTAQVPQEIFRAMDIPYVVNQWWSSVCAAKQMSPYYFGLLNEQGYREDLCHYCSLSLASTLDPENGPWGGLPRPTLLVTRYSCDSQAKIFELMAKQYGDVPLFMLENTVPITTPERWWEKILFDWEDLFDPHRLDFMVEEYKGLIRFLEVHTGRRFDETRFKEIMRLVNEQAAYNRKTRDLIAETIPAPVSITDTIPATMIPQWHRGTQWAVDQARKLYEQVKALVDRGYAAVPNERLRIMWLGRMVWFNMGMFRYFEEKYGASFIWSIYLAIAADGYAREGGDPLRALASRFAGMEDILHMPPWNVEWYVEQAKKNKVDGVIHMITEGHNSSGGTYFIRKAFEKAGIPILEIGSDPVDARRWDHESMTAVIETFFREQLGVTA
jgi:benzoyl-CoA reductase/2-hydroxyglutaryl-CoA dehydratase subunit BcrC/BadD/HgdB